MTDVTPGMIFTDILRNGKPKAVAWIRGNAENPQLSGIVKFFQTPYAGVLVETEIFGMPNIVTQFSSDFYAMHIHENGDCTLPFDKTGNHYNPTNEPHPHHAGDMVQLMANQGYAWLSFYDKRFTIHEIIGRSVVIHKMPDDFMTQPSGNSGEKIGCGVIKSADNM
ncbi:MAG: superoxide dismutase family protein [Lachnospiraceae bacterium]|nr:superoxide dismutase family protein [Lachnospiraceae bacterium]